MNMDQAFQLREIKNNIDNKKAGKKKTVKKPVVFAVSSGKGGVGKTSISLNVAISCAMNDRKVLLIDADLNLASVDVFMGITPKKAVSDMILKNRKIEDVIIKTPYLIDLIPGYSGIIKMHEMDELVRNKIQTELSLLQRAYDFVFIDTGAGIGNNVLNFINMAEEAIIVITPEPASIMDAYAVIKLITMNGKFAKVNIIANMVSSFEEATGIFKKLRMVIKKFLDVKIVLIGYVLRDMSVLKAIKLQKPFINEFPNSKASLCIKPVGERLIRYEKKKIQEVNVSFLNKIVSTVKEYA